MLDAGILVTVDINGTVQAEGGDADVFFKEFTNCGNSIAPLSYQDKGHVVNYEQMLSTRECLVAHGYAVGEPPSFEAWVDSEYDWSPYEDLLDSDQLDITEVAALQKICVQGAGGVVAAGGGGS